MKKVAKLLIVDPEDNYLLMYRSDHPVFGGDPDLPGGTVEDGETSLEAMIREVEEEAGVAVDVKAVTEVYSGTGYSKHGTHYALYRVTLRVRPEIKLSWEHSSYEWLNHGSFIQKIKDAQDTYMRMVHDTVK